MCVLLHLMLVLCAAGKDGLDGLMQIMDSEGRSLIR